MGDDNNMVSLCSATGMLAATVGDDKLTDHGMSIGLIDISVDSGFEVRRVTEPAVSAIYPAWSPDGQRLAWTQAPDSNVLFDQLSAIHPHITWGEAENRAVRQRRIWVAGDGGLGKPVQLTDDARYSDEAAVWSREGRYILFGRLDENEKQTVWLMRSNGENAVEVAAPSAQTAFLELPSSCLFDWSFR